MAIVLPQGLEITSKQPVDTRILLTKAKMLTMDDNSMPAKYLAVCVDDGKFYLYNKENEIDSEFGRFRPYEKVIDLPDAIKTAFENPETKEQLVNSISETLPGAVSAIMSGEKSDEFVEAMSQIFNDEQFDVIDKKIEIAVSLIQAIDSN